MWVLGIQDRQYWLLPGKQYTIGRTTKNSNSAVDIVIQESSVSRKHLVLEVVVPTADAVLHPSVKSELYITDLGSRFGTVLDGSRLAANDRTPVPPKGPDSVLLRVGSIVTAKLKWKNYVVSYATGQSGQAHETLWDHALALLKPLDVKLLPYIVKNTSVLVKAGSTTSTVFFALASCIPIVNSHFLQSLHTAALDASASGAKGSVTPDLTPFNPDPAWLPDPQRRTCLTNYSFHSPDEQQAAALKPIIEAAGGVYSDNGATHPPPLWVYQSEAECKSAPAGVQCIDITSVFSAITNCRGIDPVDVHHGASRLPKRPPDTESGLASKRQKKQHAVGGSHQVSRPRRERVDFFTALTSSQPSGPPSQAADPATTENATAGPLPSSLATGDPATAGPAESGPALMVEQQRTEPNEARHQQDSGVTAPKPQKQGRKAAVPPRKRPRNTQVQAPVATPPHEPEDDIAVVDYSAIGELAIVDASMDTTRKEKHASSSAEPPQDWAGRPNYKGFRRSRRPGSRRKVDYDATVSDSRSLDDEFAAPTPSPSAPPSLRAALRAASPGVWQEHDADSEESLFVSTHPDEDTRGEPEAATSMRRGLSRALNSTSRARADNDNDNDDEFSFRFS